MDRYRSMHAVESKVNQRGGTLGTRPDSSDMYAKYEPSVLALFVGNLELKCDVINVLFISSYDITFVRNVSYIID